MKLSPLARAAALDLSARLDITFQQALGGLLLLSEVTTQVSESTLRFHLSVAFGVDSDEVLDQVIARLELAGILRCDEDHADWWEVDLP